MSVCFWPNFARHFWQKSAMSSSSRSAGVADPFEFLVGAPWPKRLAKLGHRPAKSTIRLHQPSGLSRPWSRASGARPQALRPCSNSSRHVTYHHHSRRAPRLGSSGCLAGSAQRPRPHRTLARTPMSIFRPHLFRVLRLGLRLAWQVKRRPGYRSAGQAAEERHTCACQP